MQIYKRLKDLKKLINKTELKIKVNCNCVVKCMTDKFISLKKSNYIKKCVKVKLKFGKSELKKSKEREILQIYLYLYT